MTTRAKRTNTNEELPKWVEIGCVGKTMPLWSQIQRKHVVTRWQFFCGRAKNSAYHDNYTSVKKSSF